MNNAYLPPPPSTPTASPAAGPVLVTTIAEFSALMAAVAPASIVAAPYRPSWLQRVAGRTGWAR